MDHVLGPLMRQRNLNLLRRRVHITEAGRACLHVAEGDGATQPELAGIGLRPRRSRDRPHRPEPAFTTSHRGSLTTRRAWK